MNWAILLTSCVRTNERNPDDQKKEYYTRAIRDWLDKTTLPIFIIESSGYHFPEFENTRLRICTFNLENEPSSSQYEAKSILYAMDYFKEELEPYTHILKVTARYFVDIEAIICNIPDVDIVLQSHVNHDCKHNNSEIFGFRKGCEMTILGPILNLGLMEYAIYHFAESHSHYQLPWMPNIYRVKRGGDDLIVDPL